jgi:transposase
LYRRWAKKADLVLRQVHPPGKRLFVDYAGQTVPVVDSKTGEVTQASVFVAVLGASNYTYAEATLKADLESWIGSHIRTFEYLGGCPAILTPDNLKTGVTLPNRYEPDLNPTYQDMATHYQVAVIPARVRKPRDKAKVEAGVQVVERWILAALRKQTFFSIEEVNQAIRELLEKLNNRGFRKMAGSRRELFERIERPTLRSLPAERFEFAQWKWTRVTNDYHVELEEHFYSVPSNLAGAEVEIRYTAQTVEVVHNGVRVASHARSHELGGMTTVEAHRPDWHRRYLEWNWPRLMSWIDRAGPSTRAVAERMLSNAAHSDQGLRACLGLVRLGESHGAQRLEAACARAFGFNLCSYKSVASILKSGLDRLAPECAPAADPMMHDNIRGAAYFDGPEGGCHVN